MFPHTFICSFRFVHGKRCPFIYIFPLFWSLFSINRFTFTLFLLFLKSTEKPKVSSSLSSSVLKALKGPDRLLDYTTRGFWWAKVLKLHPTINLDNQTIGLAILIIGQAASPSLCQCPFPKELILSEIWRTLHPEWNLQAPGAISLHIGLYSAMWPEPEMSNFEPKASRLGYHGQI